MQNYLVTMLLTLVWTVIVSYVYYRKFKVVKNGEDFDGDVRRTIFGYMFVYHAWKATYWRHVRLNRKVYLRNILGCWVWCGSILLIIECTK